MEETLPVLGVSFAKPFLSKIGHSKASKIVEIWTFHTYLFVCMKVIICESDMSPQT